MELNGLRDVLGLSSYSSDLRRNGVGNFESGKEWNCLDVTRRKGTFSASLIRISEFRMNSKYHGRRRGEI